MTAADMERLGSWMVAALGAPDDEARLAGINAEVQEFCERFPVPGIG